MSVSAYSAENSFFSKRGIGNSSSITEKNLSKQGRKRSIKRKYLNENKSLKMIGVNAAGINSKLESFNAMLVKLKPQIWCVQETKLKENETLKCEDIKDFQVYYLYRQNSGGGGLALGIDKKIESTLILQGDDETEVLVVLADVGGLLVRIVIGYGPQENSLKSYKDKF